MHTVIKAPKIISKKRGNISTFTVRGCSWQSFSVVFTSLIFKLSAFHYTFWPYHFFFPSWVWAPYYTIWHWCIKYDIHKKKKEKTTPLKKFFFKMWFFCDYYFTCQTPSEGRPRGLVKFSYYNPHTVKQMNHNIHSFHLFCSF